MNDTLLIGARAVHFAAAISLCGGFAFTCIVGHPALRQARVDGASLRRRIAVFAWVSLLVALLSGALWLTATSAVISSQPVAAVWSQGIILTVLAQTRFGEDWLVRLGLIGLLTLCLLIGRVRGIAWAGFGLAAVLLASLARAGHGGATPGTAGGIHLAGDIVHLLGAGLWLGTLPPFELLLATARRAYDPAWLTAARLATRRFTVLAAISVGVLLAGGIINTWFLAGTVPTLVGTSYGRLLLTKIGLFLAMLLVAAVNLLRLTPRLDSGPAQPTLAQLHRNALIETAIGLGVIGIVGALGTMPPGIHSEPIWPLPFRLDFAALPTAILVVAAAAAALAVVAAIATVGGGALGQYRRAAIFAGGAVFGLVVAAAALAPAAEPAYPTSFVAPARPYSATSVAAGAPIYTDNCAACHGTEGHGDGPATASMTVRPADLTAPHLFAHLPGELFWWISHGRGNAMPGFAETLTPGQRWDVINFILARAAGTLSRGIGTSVNLTTAYPMPDFAFETDAGQNTLQGLLRSGPVLLAIIASPHAEPRLAELSAVQAKLVSSGVQIMIVPVTPNAENDRSAKPAMPLLVAVSDQVAEVLRLFQTPEDGGETDLLVDRSGNIRARWTATRPGLPTPATLAAAAARLKSAPTATGGRHAGHSHAE